MGGNVHPPAPFIWIPIGCWQSHLSRDLTRIDQIVGRIAPEFGGIVSVTARTDTGLLIVTVWEDADRVGAFTAHPEVKAAQVAAKLPMPASFERCEEAACAVSRP